ncbi:MAG: CRISPR system precrRNA processing endoribonuclease RAMP protein Cas6 [Candidatus Hatepunaea meridiana]|nr:CRISPR system precrRNA processing endoribonuclease RAMP protein Cas6 [Candidatus Hatepunaea meridiana]
MDHPFNDSNLILSHLTLTGLVRRPLIWNSYPGSVLHGALGFTLKDMSCAVEGGECDDCYLAVQCPYSLFLETQRPEGAERMRKYNRVPSPLRLLVKPWDHPVLEAGEDVRIELVIVGKASQYAIPVLMALDKVLSDGIGKKDRNDERGSVQLKTICDAIRGEEIIWDQFRFDKGLPFQPVSWSELISQHPLINRIEFTSPTRIVTGGRISSHPTIRDILSTLFRRVSNLAYFHCGVELEAKFKDLLDEAGALTLQSEFERIKASRYSGRQKSRFRIDGITGIMDVTNLPDHFYPWLALGSYLGVGKGTTMGMGQYECY